MHPARSLAPILLIAGLCFAQDPTFTPGQETRVTAPTYRGYYLVYVPADYQPDRPWPVILTYYGYNGKPNTSPFKQITAGKHFIIVGMDYVSQAYHENPAAALKENKALLPPEVENVHRVLDTLAQQLNVDRDRVVMGGFSQGGYQTSVLGEAMLHELCGLAILGAGRTYYTGAFPPDLALIRGKPVILGAGANDTTHRTRAEQSFGHYRSWNADVTLDIWPDKGHSPDTNSEKLRHWVLERGPLTNVEKRLDAAEQSDDPAAALRLCDEIADVDPTHPQCQRAAAMRDTLAEPYRARLTEAQQAFDAGDVPRGIELATAVGVELHDTSIERRVIDMLTALSNNPATADVAQQALTDLKANKLEAAARLLEDAGKHDAAMKAYKAYLDQCAGATRYETVKAHVDEYAQQVNLDAAIALRRLAEEAEQAKDYDKAIALYDRLVTDYPSAEGHAEVAEHLASLRADPKVQRAAKTEAAAADCKPQLSMARSYLAAKRPELAKPLLQKVIDDHPDTDWADQARELLAQTDH